MIPTLALAALFAVVGFLLGFAHFTSLHRNVRAYVAGGARSRVILLHVLRLAALALAWLLVAKTAGPIGLLAAFAGFLVARPIVTTRLGRAP
jgi:F1F0 ATPase subunit 2